MDQLSYLRAVVIGSIQGVTELFPDLQPWPLGPDPCLARWQLGNPWSSRRRARGAVPGVHRRAARRHRPRPAPSVLAGLGGHHPRILLLDPASADRDDPERLAWLIVLATIPAGITGLLLEHSLRTLFANPLAAAVFLTLNGLILLTTEHLRRRAPGTVRSPSVTRGPRQRV